MSKYTQDTFHILRDKRIKGRLIKNMRTTVCVDKILSQLLALKLGSAPETPEAHAAIRSFLQAKLNEGRARDPGETRISGWLHEQIVLEVVDNKLSKQYWKWFDTTTAS